MWKKVDSTFFPKCDDVMKHMLVAVVQWKKMGDCDIKVFDVGGALVKS